MMSQKKKAKQSKLAKYPDHPYRELIIRGSGSEKNNYNANNLIIINQALI